MILTGTAIQQAISDGSIIYEPFTPDLLNPNSINYRIGDTLFVLDDGVVDPQKTQGITQLPFSEEGYELQPGKLYLSHTAEKLGSSAFVPKLIGRSSLGRLGLYLQVTADLGQLGNAHQWTLELRVVQPLRIYPNMRIGQVSFWCTDGQVEAIYTGGYTAHNAPHGYKERNYL